MNVEPSLWERASWRIRHGALLSLVALASLAIIGALLWRGYPAPRVRGEEVAASISGFAPEDAPRFGRGIIVTATDGHAYGERDVPLESVEGCKVGDPIRAVRRGLALMLYPIPCKAKR